MKSVALLAVVIGLVGCAAFNVEESHEPVRRMGVEWKGATWRFCNEGDCARPTKKTIQVVPELPRVAEQKIEPVKAIGAPVIREKVQVHFPFKSAKPTAKGMDQIKRAAKLVKEGDILILDGRTDAVGSDAANEKLAKERAEFVAVELKRLGVKAAIEFQGEGKCCYVATNEHEAGRAANRRVEIQFSTAIPSRKEK